MLNYSATPIQAIDHLSCRMAGVRLLIKREDLNHPTVSGNKWWKLKYNLAAAIHERHQTVLTFGGAYSNHIYATAAAAKNCGLRSIGIIRGEETLPLNPTLTFAKENGMEIRYVSRTAYREKTTPAFLDDLRLRFGPCFVIPEGGTNHLALKGCAEFAEQHLSPIDFDYLFLPVGTGGTMAGIVSGLPGERKVVGISVLKNGATLHNEIDRFICEFAGKPLGNWSLLTEYHEGGYAKRSPRLMSMIAEMNSYGIPLDHVYTGKLLLALISEVESGAFMRGTTILALHTGGLQGSLQHLTSPASKLT